MGPFCGHAGVFLGVLGVSILYTQSSKVLACVKRLTPVQEPLSVKGAQAAAPYSGCGGGLLLEKALLLGRRKGAPWLGCPLEIGHKGSQRAPFAKGIR